MIKNYLNELADFLEFRYPTKKFSNDLGFSQSTVSVYLNDKVKISKHFIEKLNEVYKINYKEFVKELQKKENNLNEPEISYGDISGIERSRILNRLIKLKNDAENYLDLLENTPKSAHVLEETAKTLEILKKVNSEITDIENN